jgi:hypothetical protein
MFFVVLDNGLTAVADWQTASDQLPISLSNKRAIDQCVCQRRTKKDVTLWLS